MKLGLKLWSINTNYYFDEARKLYGDGWFDYIELYIVPGSLNTLGKWKTLEIPFTLHAPHFMHEVNLADPEKFDRNTRIFAEVEQFRGELNASYTVVHSGIEGSIEETARQLKLIMPRNMIIENKPYMALNCENKKCRGSEISEIKYIMKQTGCGFCLDVGHAVCTANALRLNPYDYLQKFNELDPACYHLSDNHIENKQDRHLHLGHGSYDIERILGIIDSSRNIAIETSKSKKDNLDDFVEDVIFLRKKYAERKMKP